MKKFLITAVFLILLSPPAFSAQSSPVVISNVQGKPNVIRHGQTMPATVGMACEDGDIIKTSPECMADVSVNDLAGCRVLSSSECEVVNAQKSAMKLKITTGNAILNLEKLPADSSFEVETPTAVATVRGTQFWGRVDTKESENPVTTFAVREGFVDIFAQSAGKSFTIHPGEALDIPKELATTPAIRPALAQEMKAMEQAPSIKTTI